MSWSDKPGRVWWRNVMTEKFLEEAAGITAEEYQLLSQYWVKVLTPACIIYYVTLSKPLNLFKLQFLLCKLKTVRALISKGWCQHNIYNKLCGAHLRLLSAQLTLTLITAPREESTEEVGGLHERSETMGDLWSQRRVPLTSHHGWPWF